MLLIIILLLIIIINLMNVYFRKEKIIENNTGYDMSNTVKDCIVDWDEEYGPCSSSCGGGTQELGYTVLQEPKDGSWNGKPNAAILCPKTIKRNCNEQPCPVDCEGVWGQWSPCEKEDETLAKCGGGKRSRSYNITQPAVDGYIDGVLTPGTACPYNNDDIQEEDCNVKPCAIDCVGAWGEFGDCNKQTGTKFKTYNVDTPAQDGYIYNTDQVEEEDKAVQCVAADDYDQYHPCDVDCELGEWVDLGGCNKNTGKQKQTRPITINRWHDGNFCGSMEREIDCDVDCEMSTWSSWSTCSKGCGSGTQTATRTITQPKHNSGADCGNLTKSTTCEGNDCIPLHLPSPPTYCCTASRKRGDMTDNEVKELRKWHFNQSDIWIKGYDVWGKIIADNLVSKSKWQSDRVRDFYYHKIHGVRTIGSVYADMVIYPMTYLIGGYKILINKN